MPNIPKNWKPVSQPPKEYGQYWVIARTEDGTILKPFLTRYSGPVSKFVIDTPDGREYETWGHDGAFHGTRVIAWYPIILPPYKSTEKQKGLKN